jgi:hypothetical protein
MVIRCEKNRKLGFIRAKVLDVLGVFEMIEVQEVLVRAGNPLDQLGPGDLDVLEVL